ncbi:cysteine peptidase family C39 domain-containing protein [Aeromonas dhakensis]|uniref:cysteine peptidase family C39 domain-containing protein n=1 Tax=Aeromonas dhakensis TaxID=196024 RepID=UPI002442281C|nr:cysteine peptidase family C39 domain-containing protein [Aeromonas dhakensis]
MGPPLPPPMVSGIHCLGFLMHFFQLPLNKDQLLREQASINGPFDGDRLVRLCRQFGLKSRRVTVKPERLEKTPLPAIAWMNDGRFILLAKIADGKALVQDGLTGQVEKTALDDFCEHWSGELVLATHRAPVLGQGGQVRYQLVYPCGDALQETAG